MDAHDPQRQVGGPDGRAQAGQNPIVKRKQAAVTTTGKEPQGKSTLRVMDDADLRRQVEDVVKTAPVIDIHTHLYPPEFGDLSLFGIDELMSYHYLIAETFRST